MRSQARFRVNAPGVVAEAVDDEVIIINLHTGTYYSLSQAGAAVWESLEAGTTLGDAIGSVQGHYQEEPAVIAKALEDFVVELEAERLIVPGAEDDTADRAGDARPVPPLVAPHPVADQPLREFVAPRLEPYIDMKNLIQLDPVLAVDERGWPVTERR